MKGFGVQLTTKIRLLAAQELSKRAQRCPSLSFQDEDFRFTPVVKSEPSLGLGATLTNRYFIENTSISSLWICTQMNLKTKYHLSSKELNSCLILESCLHFYIGIEANWYEKACWN